MRLPLPGKGLFGHERILVATNRFERLAQVRNIVELSPRLFEGIVDTQELKSYMQELMEVMTDTQA